MPNPPVAGWKSYQSEAQNSVDANAFKALEKEYKRVHTLAAAGPLGAKPDDVSEAAIFALDEKGPNAQFLTSYSGERSPVRISFEALEKILDEADGDALAAPGAAAGTRLTAEEKALAAGAAPLDNEGKPSIEFEGAESAIQYLKARYMIQRGFLGGPPADAKYTNLNNILINLRKSAPNEAKQLADDKSLIAVPPPLPGGAVNPSLNDFIAAPHAALPNPGAHAGDLNTQIRIMTEQVVTKHYIQNPALADSLMQTVNPDGTPKQIFVLDEKKEIAENKLLNDVRNDPQVRLAARLHQSEAKAAATAPDLSKEIKSLHGNIEKQHIALATLAKRTLISANGLEKMLPRTAYPFHEAKHLIDGFNYAKEQILAKTAPANLEKVSLILGKQQRQISIHYAKLTQGEFSLNDWNNAFKDARRELNALGVSNDALDKLQNDSLRDQIKADNRTIKEKANNAYTALLNDEIRMQQANQNRSNWQRFSAAFYKTFFSEASYKTYDAELKKQETARLIEFKYLGPEVKNPNPDGRAFATIVANNVQVRPGSELRAGTLVNANSPYTVQVSEQKNAQGEKEFHFKTFYKKAEEAEAAYRNEFKAIKSRAGTNEITVTFSNPESVITKDVIGMLKAARDEKMAVHLDINQLMAMKPPTTPEEREQFAEIERLHNLANQAAELEKKQMRNEAKAVIPPLDAEKIADNQAAKQMTALQTKAHQSLRTLSQEIKQAAPAAKDIPAALKKAENHIQELKTRLQEAKDEFWRIRQEYKLTESKLPAAPAKEEYDKQILLKNQLDTLLNVSAELAYAQERLRQRLDDYKAVPGLDPAAQGQATQLSNNAKAIGNELDKFIHTEMQGSSLAVPPAYAPPNYLPPGAAIPAALPVGPNLFKDAVASAQLDEKKPEAQRQYKM